MRTVIFVLLEVCFGSLVMSQRADDTSYALNTNRLMFGVSSVALYDGYLSNIPYDGLALRFYNENRRYPAPDMTDISLLGNLDVSMGATLNRAQSAVITYVGAEYAWGILYHFKPVSDFFFAAGPLLNVDATFKYNDRNINNPFNMDASTNLLLAGTITYDLPILGRTFRMKADVRTPLLGCMFVPMRGASYYEIATFGDFEKAVHLSSLHNKNGIVVLYAVDIPLNHAVVSLGLSGRNMRYKANDMVFIRNELSILLGYTVDMYVFSGNKHQPPKGFIKVDR